MNPIEFMKANGLVEITGENKAGNCPYKDMCKRYERTVKKKGYQLSLF